MVTVFVICIVCSSAGGKKSVSFECLSVFVPNAGFVFWGVLVAFETLL